MAEYAILPDPPAPDRQLELTWALIDAAMLSLRQIALPPKRLDLELPARELAQLLREKART